MWGNSNSEPSNGLHNPIEIQIKSLFMMQLSSCGEGKLEIFGNNWCTLNPIWRALSLQLCFQRNLQLKTCLKISVSLSHTAYVNVQIDLENMNIRYFRFKGGVGGLKIKQTLENVLYIHVSSFSLSLFHCSATRNNLSY